jgi:hypothetical protein
VTVSGPDAELNALNDQFVLHGQYGPWPRHATGRKWRAGQRERDCGGHHPGL